MRTCVYAYLRFLSELTIKFSYCGLLIKVK